MWCSSWEDFSPSAANCLYRASNTSCNEWCFLFLKGHPSPPSPWPPLHPTTHYNGTWVRKPLHRLQDGFDSWRRLPMFDGFLGLAADASHFVFSVLLLLGLLETKICMSLFCHLVKEKWTLKWKTNEKKISEMKYFENCIVLSESFLFKGNIFAEQCSFLFCHAKNLLLISYFWLYVE